jgi:hypothetical protein
LIQLQRIQLGAVALLEFALMRDLLEIVEGRSFPLRQAHGPAGDVFEDLTTRQVTDVAGVGVSDQQKRIFFHHFPNAVDIDLAGRGGLDQRAPVGANKII